MKLETTPEQKYAAKIAADSDDQAALLRLDIGSQAGAEQLSARLAAIEHFAAMAQSHLANLQKPAGRHPGSRV